MVNESVGKKAVVIDFFGTLTPSTPNEVWAEHAAVTAAALGVRGEDWGPVMVSSWVERASGTLYDLSESIRILAARLGVTPTEVQISAACEARRRTQRSLFVFRDDVLAALSELRARGLRIGLLSDCSSELPEAWPELSVAEFFDATVFSCDVGFRKPDPRMFALIAERLGVTPGECLYLGDGGGHELTGATEAGMTAVMLRAPDWELNAAYSREDDWDGDFVGSFTEFLGRPEIAVG